MFVCPECFPERSLRLLIEKALNTGDHVVNCDFHKDELGISIGEVAKIIDGAFKEYFVPGCWYPDKDIIDCVKFLTKATNENIVAELANSLIAQEKSVLNAGQSPHYGLEIRYIDNIGDDKAGYAWDDFCDTVKYHNRYIKNHATEYLNEFFDGIHLLDNAINSLQAGEVISRARLAKDSDEAKMYASNPQKELCSPPEKARRANRLNPSGIRCFYGAYGALEPDKDVAISELRPPVGGIGVVAEFKLLRPINVLDTTQFGSSPEYPIFGKNSAIKYRLHRFMKDFMGEVSKPTQPIDEHIDYIPMQIFAEYFLHEYKFNNRQGEEVKIEGIMYNSAQFVGGTNLALFGDAATTPQDILDMKNRFVFSGEEKRDLSKDDIKNCGLVYVDKSARFFEVYGVDYSIGKGKKHYNEIPAIEIKD